MSGAGGVKVHFMERRHSSVVDMRFDLDPDDVFAASSGENFAGRARDRAECEVFVRARRDADADADVVVDDALNERQTIRAACVAMNAHVERACEGHVWHKEPPMFEPASTSFVTIDGVGALARLRAFVDFGDDVDDAWALAHLARELSLREDVAATRVWDDDGEFLLIETAETLPGWVTPERATGTTFLRRGALCVVDAERAAGASTSTSVEAVTVGAVEMLLRDGDSGEEGSSTYALSAETQRTLRRRLDAFPARMRENRHDAFAMLPASVAHVLHHDPQLVSAAIDSFRARDPVGLRAAAKMVKFAPEKFTPALVRMSRCLFSQVSREYFEAPKCYPMPTKSSGEFKAYEIGMKIACGMEMMLADDAPDGGEASSSSPDKEGANIIAAEPVGNKGWDAFKRSLVSNGYFRGEMVGSALYKKLMANAIREFKGFLSREAGSKRARDTPAARARAWLRTEMTTESTKFNVKPSDASDESWLHDAEKELNEELAKLEREREGAVRDAAHTARSFVERQSGFEGAEQSHRRRPTNHNDKDGSCPGDLNIPDGDEIYNLDASSFLRELGKALGVGDDERLQSYVGGRRDADENSDSDDDDVFDSDDDIFESDSDDGPPRDDDFFAEAKSEANRRFVHIDENLADSDDDESSVFFNKTYDAVLREQLSGTKLDADIIQTASSARNAGEIEAHLARGLLASASASAGAPGPAVGLMSAAGVAPSDVRNIMRADVRETTDEQL